MSIKLGTQNISAIYKGDTEIVKRYKGTQVIYESSVFLPYSYEYLYNSLIPETISGKSVKNKAKVSKIYANGVVENQGVKITNTSQSKTLNGLELIDNRDGSYIINGTATAETFFQLGDVVPITIGHKYLTKGGNGGSSSTYYLTQNSSSGANDYGNGVIYTQPNNNYGRFMVVVIKNGTTLNNVVFRPQHFDLTLMFGTGNEPTTLTDTRIQKILNRGYIAYNTGTYKGTDISEFSSEPYNLFDESDTTLRYNSLYLNSLANGGGIGGTNYSIVLPIQGGLTYTVERASVVSSRFRICSINEIPTSGTFTNTSPYYAVNDGGSSLTIPTRQSDNYLIINLDTNETNFINQLASLCIHIQGTRTGYATHQTFSPLSFIYQGNGALNSHDTFEITSTEYVFTKNVGSVDMGTLIYSYVSSQNIFLVVRNYLPANFKQDSTNGNQICCEKYPTMAIANINNVSNNTLLGFDSYNGQFLVIKTTDYSSGSDFKTAMSGVMLYYELATPQVIRIPKKHLGIVDLGSLNYGMSSAGRFYINATTRIDNVKIPTTQDEIANIYCKEYMVINGYQASNYSANLAFGINSNGYLYIRDDSCSTIAELQAKLSGVYLFYETQNEVSDITDTIGIEKGGTITSNMFSYISNQLVQNGNFVSTSGYSSSQNSLSVADNVLTILIGSPTSAGSVAVILFYSNVNVVSGHKYLITTQIKPPVNGSCAIKGTSDSFPEVRSNITIDTWNEVSGIATATNSQSIDMQFNIYNTEIIRANDSFYLKDFMVIDLTLAFGSGKEPSTVDDQRIQYILGLGYIPFDATGTRTGVPSQVLPNVDFKIKCK